MEKEMEKEKNMILMDYYNMKENIYSIIKEKEKNILMAN